MKKFLCTLLVVLLVLIPCTLNVCAANDGTVGAEAYYGAPGEIVEVPIRYTSNPGFWIMYLGVYFDPEIFEYESVEKGDYDKVDITPNNYSNPGKIVLLFEGKEHVDITGDGVIATLKLKIKDNAPVGNYAVVLSIGDGMAVNFDVKYVQPTMQNGSVYVVCKTHDFKDDICSICGAVREGEKITVDTEKLPEAVKPIIKDEDVSDTLDSSSDTSAGENSSSDADKSDTDGNVKPDNITIIIMCVISALLIAGVIVFVIIKKKKQ